MLHVYPYVFLAFGDFHFGSVHVVLVVMVINGRPLDKLSFVLPNFVVKECSEYVYLGNIFTSDGKTDSSLKAHLESKNKELNKLLIFFATNYDAPFAVKKKVLEAAFMSCILYGCEAWLNVPLKMAESMYMKAVKALLGVRITTPNDLCLIESGLKPLKSIVQKRQKKFFEKMLDARSDMNDDPFMHAFGVTKDMNKTMWTYIESVMDLDDAAIENGLSDVKVSIQNQPLTATKFHTYQTLNPTLDVHPLYTASAPTIPDYLRIEFTRYRLSSHRLRVEIGRWSRTPPEERVCSCGTGIQNESHIFECPLVEELFQTSDKSYSSPADLFRDTNIEDLKILYKVLNKLYETDEQQPLEPE